MPDAASTATITVYSKADCHLCDEAILALRRLQDEFKFALKERDITSEEALHRTYFDRIPVIEIDGEELCEHFLAEKLVRERLESRR
jgi:glutaredoxin